MAVFELEDKNKQRDPFNVTGAEFENLIQAQPETKQNDPFALSGGELQKLIASPTPVIDRRTAIYGDDLDNNLPEGYGTENNTIAQIQPQQQTPAAPQGQPFLSSQNEKPFIPGAEQATADDADLMTLADRVGKTDEWGNNFLYQFGKGALSGGMNVASGLAGLVNVATGDNKFTRTIADTLNDAAKELAPSKELSWTDSEFYTNPEGLFYGLGNLVGSSAGLGTLASGFGWAAGKAAKAAMPYFTKLASKSPFAAKVMEKMTPIKELYSNWQANHGKLNAAGKLLAGQLYGAPFDAGANAGSVGNEWLQEHPGDVDGARDVAFRAFMAELPVDFLNAVVGLAGLHMNPLTSKAAIKPLAKDIAAGTAAYISVAKDIAKMAGYTALDSASEGYQESVQDLSGRYAKGEVSLNRAYNPILWDEKDWNTFGTVAIENAIIGGLGGAANTAADIIDDTPTGKINREALGDSKANIAATDDNIIQKEENTDEKNEDNISLRELQNPEDQKSQPVEEQEGNGGEEAEIIQQTLANAPASKVKYYQEAENDEDSTIPKEFFEAKIATAKSLKEVENVPGDRIVYELLAKNGQKYYASIDVSEPGTVEPAGKVLGSPVDERNIVGKGNSVYTSENGGFTARTEDGTEVRGQYAFRTPENLKVSNDPFTFRPNENYPKEFQPRDRSSAVMQQQVLDIARKLDPSRLAGSDGVNTGAPIADEDGNVLNGNGRAMAILNALNENGEVANTYRQYLIDHAEEYGFTPDTVRGILQEHPNAMLVRSVNVDDVTKRKITGAEGGGMKKNAGEEALADARDITPSVWATYVPNDTGDITNSTNNNFVKSVLGKIVEKDPSLQNKFFTDKGITQDGYRRVQNAMFAYAYNDDSVVASVANGDDALSKNIVKGLLRAAPNVAKCRSMLAKDNRQDLDFISDLLDACKKLNSFKGNEAAMLSYINSEALFGDGDISSVAKRIAEVLFYNRTSAKKIGDFVGAMADNVLSTLENEASDSMFGDEVEAVSLGGIVDAAAKAEGVIDKKQLLGAQPKSAEEVKNLIGTLAEKSWNDNNFNDRVDFPASDNLKKAAIEIIGHSIDTVFITSSDVRHIRNEHSKGEGDRGQANITPQDIPEIYDIVNNFDKVEAGKDDNKGNKKMLVIKHADGNSTVVLWEKGSSKLQVNTFYKQNKKKLDSMTDGDETPRRNAQSDSATTSIDSTLPQNNKNVKKKEAAAKNLTQLKDAVDGKPIRDGIEDLAKDVNDIKPDPDRNFIKNAFEQGGIINNDRISQLSMSELKIIDDIFNGKKPNIKPTTPSKKPVENPAQKKLTLPQKQKILKDYLAEKNIAIENFMEAITMGGYLKGNGLYSMTVDVVKSHESETDIKKWADSFIGAEADLFNEDGSLTDNIKEKIDAQRHSLGYNKKYEKKPSPREKVRASLRKLIGQPITNKDTNTVAFLATNGINKATSNAAVDKSKANGFTEAEHLEAAENIKQLFEDAKFIGSKDDDNGYKNVRINRYDCNTTVGGNKKAVAHITVKETVENGQRIYSVELLEITNPADAESSSGTFSAGSELPQEGVSTGDLPADNSTIVDKTILQDNKDVNKKDKVNAANNIKQLKEVVDNGGLSQESKIKNLAKDVEEAKYTKEVRELANAVTDTL